MENSGSPSSAYVAYYANRQNIGSVGNEEEEDDDVLDFDHDYVLDDEDEEYMMLDGFNDDNDNYSQMSAYDLLLPVDSYSALRRGTLSSATINLLTSMVGGGSLSLPYAFAKAGDIVMAPFLLAMCAASAGLSLKFLMDSSARASHLVVAAASGTSATTNSRNPTTTTRMTYDRVALYAFGPRAQYLSMIMVVGVCFVGVIGYSVLLRDLGKPLAHIISAAMGDDKSSSSSGQTEGRPTLIENAIMWCIIALVSPLTTLKTLTALKSVGTLSIISVMILGVCVVYRSTQCLNSSYNYNAEGSTHDGYNNIYDISSGRFLQEDQNSTSSFPSSFTQAPYVHPHYQSITLSLWPKSVKEFLDAFPIILNCFFCQFNAVPVHSELRYPTKRRSAFVAKAVVICAFIFYLIIGLFGSMFGSKCTVKGHVSDNILLDFDDDDPVVTVARTCLTVVISFAFPLQVMPARDTILRLWEDMQLQKRERKLNKTRREANEGLTEALISDDVDYAVEPTTSTAPASTAGGASKVEQYDENARTSTSFSDGADVADDGSLSDINFVSMYERPTAATSSVPDFEATSKLEEEMDLAYRYNNTNYSSSSINDDTIATVVTSRRRRKMKCCTNSLPPSKKRRILVALTIFWTAALIASIVKSIAIVWDFLGSTLVIMVGFIMPSAMYLKLCKGATGSQTNKYSIMAWAIIVVYIPLMILCTTNAVWNALF